MKQWCFSRNWLSKAVQGEPGILKPAAFTILHKIGTVLSSRPSGTSTRQRSRRQCPVVAKLQKHCQQKNFQMKKTFREVRNYEWRKGNYNLKTAFFHTHTLWQLHTIQFWFMEVFPAFVLPGSTTAKTPQRVQFKGDLQLFSKLLIKHELKLATRKWDVYG